ncbi:organic cation transporter protein-like [Anticarsia gemmatalis]|uniref:organic cation transporter protein-like n=1 Tax=Anticarsia gemmatalis TaxID=129554 RepID=UPI003F75E31C
MPVDLDAILVELGQFGPYQIKNFCLILLTILFSAVYNCQYVFAAGAVDYRCKVPECESSPPVFTTNGWGLWALPDSDSVARCNRFVPVAEECAPESFLVNQTKTCSSWVYESHHTIVAEFDLACEEWKRTLVGTIHSAGVFIALALTATISDNYGRRIALVITAVSPAIVGIVRAFSTSYPMYISLELLEAIVGAGVYSTGFILALEMVGASHRVLCGNLISSTFALGQVTAALVAWAVPDWSPYTLIIYTPSILFLSYYWIIQESVRWLLSKGRKQEAAEIIFKVAEMNKKKLSAESVKMITEDDAEMEKVSLPMEEKVETKSMFLQVIKSRKIMFRLCVCSFWWITLTFVYYGLSINSVSLAGNSYVNYILTSLVEIPGYFISAVTLNRFGRKSSIMTAFLICAVSLVALPFVPITWLQTTLNLLGKLSISMAFSSIYIYTGELFPTQARHSLLGACSMVGRIGSVIAPQTPLLAAYMESLPYLIFGIMAGTAGLLMMLTPETLNTKLPDTIEQAENIKQESKEHNGPTE